MVLSITFDIMNVIVPHKPQTRKQNKLMKVWSSLVDLLDGGAGGRSSSRSTTSSGEATWHPACILVQLGHDGITDLLQLLLLMLKLILFCRLRKEGKKGNFSIKVSI